MSKEIAIASARMVDMFLSEGLVREDHAHITGRYGNLPNTFQDAFDEAIMGETKPEFHKAFVILDRWRFANKPRSVQLKEHQTLKENWERSLTTDTIMGVNPDDLADLIIPEGVNQLEWLQVIPATPPNGFASVVPEEAYRE